MDVRASWIGQTIGELPKGYKLYAVCRDCRRPQEQLDVFALMARFSTRATYDRLEARLRCRRCRMFRGRLVFVFDPGMR